MQFLRRLFSRLLFGSRKNVNSLSIAPVPDELIEKLSELGLNLTVETQRIALILRNDDDIGGRLYVIRYCVGDGEECYLMQRYLRCGSGWEAQHSKQYSLNEIKSFFEKRLALQYQQSELEIIPKNV